VVTPSHLLQIGAGGKSLTAFTRNDPNQQIVILFEFSRRLAKSIDEFRVESVQYLGAVKGEIGLAATCFVTNTSDDTVTADPLFANVTIRTSAGADIVRPYSALRH